MPPTDRHNPFVQYFVNVWTGIATTYVGMRLTGRYLFRRPVTMLYPEVRPIIYPGHRGLHGYDEEKCISCLMCATACPVDCITIESVGKGKDALMTRFDIDYTRCLFCDLCTEPCPSDCIWMTEQYDLASTSREDCIVHFARTKTSEEIEAHKTELARKEAEKKAKAAEAAAAKKAAEAKTPDES